MSGPAVYSYYGVCHVKPEENTGNLASQNAATLKDITVYDERASYASIYYY